MQRIRRGNSVKPRCTMSLKERKNTKQIVKSANAIDINLTTEVASQSGAKPAIEFVPRYSPPYLRNRKKSYVILTKKPISFSTGKRVEVSPKTLNAKKMPASKKQQKISTSANSPKGFIATGQRMSLRRKPSGSSSKQQVVSNEKTPTLKPTVLRSKKPLLPHVKKVLKTATRKNKKPEKISPPMSQSTPGDTPSPLKEPNSTLSTTDRALTASSSACTEKKTPPCDDEEKTMNCVIRLHRLRDSVVIGYLDRQQEKAVEQEIVKPPASGNMDNELDSPDDIFAFPDVSRATPTKDEDKQFFEQLKRNKLFMCTTRTKTGKIRTITKRTPAKKHRFVERQQMNTFKMPLPICLPSSQAKPKINIISCTTLAKPYQLDAQKKIISPKNVDNERIKNRTIEKLLDQPMKHQPMKNQPMKHQPMKHSQIRNMLPAFQSTPAQSFLKKDKTALQNLSMQLSPIAKMNNSLDTLSPWRAEENLPRTLYFGNAPDHLPSYSSDFLNAITPQTSPTRNALADKSNILQQTSLECSNKENINQSLSSPKRVSPMQRTASGLRSPLRALQNYPIKSSNNKLPIEKKVLPISSLAIERNDSGKMDFKENISTLKKPRCDNSIEDYFGFDSQESDDELCDPRIQKAVRNSKLNLKKNLFKVKQRVSLGKPNRIDTAAIKNLFRSPSKQTDIREILREPNRRVKILKAQPTREPVVSTTLKSSELDICAVAETTEQTNVAIPSKDNAIVPLFVDNSEEEKPKPRRNYTRHPLKRKRRTWYGLSESEGEDGEPENKIQSSPQRQKPTKRHKVEQREAEELNSFCMEFNSMCSEVERFPLVIERTSAVN